MRTFPHATVPDPDPKPEPERKPRVSRGLVALVIGLLVLLWQREEITFRFNLMAILRSEAPEQGWMRDLGASDEHALIMVERLWSTGRLPHRRAVVDFLRGQTARRPQLMRECVPMLMEAARDPDHSLRELLISGMKSAKIEEWREFAMLQLGDADPSIKVYAMNFLRINRVTNALPRIGLLLHDRDVGVRVSAALTLQKFAAEDFGLQPGMGFEADESSGSERRSAIQNARDWWRKNVPQANETNALGATPRTLPPLKFVTRDHEAISSADWRGTPTFLQFFASYCASCDQVLPEVQELLARRPQINVFGVSLDAIPDDHNHFFDIVDVPGHEGHDHGHHGHGHAHHEVDTKAIVEASSKLLVSRRLGYRVFYDVTGEATGWTDGGEIPVGIFLDAEGNLVRRFVGPRSASALGAMLRADFPAAFEDARE